MATNRANEYSVIIRNESTNTERKYEGKSLKKAYALYDYAINNSDMWRVIEFRDGRYNNLADR